MKKHRKSLWRKWWNWLWNIPHLFSKLVVLWCILAATAFSLYAMRILSRTGHDPAALLGVVLAFFGGELLILCLKRILGDK